MGILITGATGQIGRKLIEALFIKGHTDIRILTRDTSRAAQDFSLPLSFYQWDIEKNWIDPSALINVDTIIHLAGEGVADEKWSEARKKRILDSRIKSAELLLNEIKKQKPKGIKFISASAIGIYGDNNLGNGFLAEVCKKWEEVLLTADLPALKKHILRIGIVLMPEGGALSKMVPPFELGLGGPIGEGSQYMSWIHIDDLIAQFIFLVENSLEPTIFNGVAETPVTNKEFTKTLAKVLNRPAVAKVPATVIKAILGEMSEMVLFSQEVYPNEFKKLEFKFKFPKLQEALTDILKYKVNGESRLVNYQFIPQDIKTVFPFFMSETNLEKLTPPYLNFKVLGKSTDTIRSGTIIDYKLHLHGIPINWKTKIDSFIENEQFVDEQIKGPYQKWHHTHTFIPLKSGTLMIDEVTYKLPMGILGKIVAHPFVKKDVETIFKFRTEVIKQLFK
ncbi:MAG: TIGR01777 family oxidoreductase [Bacteriovoracaceae bacterium]